MTQRIGQFSGESPSVQEMIDEARISPEKRRAIELSQPTGKGWWGEPERHSEARKKASEKKE